MKTTSRSRLSLHLVAATLASFVMMASASAEPPQRPSQPSGSESGGGSDGGSLGDIFGGIFGDSEEKPEIARLEAGADFADIIVDRRRSLRLFHSYGTGIAPQPELHGYVNSILDRLAAALPVKNLPVAGHVMGVDGFSASAAPCGAIAIDWGMLRSLRTEDELAFVLAHEIAHVLFRHHQADWFVDAQHVSVASAEIAEEFVNKVEQKSPLSIDPSGKLSRAVKIGRVSYHLSRAVLLPAWTREQEEVADRFAVDLLVRAGYNHASFLTFFATMDAWEKQIADPESGDPLAVLLQSGVDPLNWTDPDTLIDNLLDSSGALIETLFGGEDHPSAIERRDALQQYLLRLYKKARLARNTPLPWAESGTGGKVAALNSLYSNASQAFQKLQQGDTGTAADFAGKSITDDTRSDGYPRMAFYQVRLAQNQMDKAKANLDFALKSPRPGVDLFRKRIQFAEDAGQWVEAARILDDARRRLDDPPALLPARIRIYPQVGRAHELPPVLLECRVTWRANAEECEAAMEKSRL